VDSLMLSSVEKHQLFFGGFADAIFGGKASAFLWWIR
jgi:hypothetical protein